MAWNLQVMHMTMLKYELLTLEKDSPQLKENV